METKQLKKKIIKKDVKKFFKSKIKKIRESKDKILYSAVVLEEDSRDKVLALMRLCVDVPEDWERLADHMTIVFKEGLPEELKKDLGKDVTLTIKTIGISDDAIAVGVEGYPSTKDNPHITLAIPPDGKPAQFK